MQDIPLKYPLQKRNTKKEQNQGTELGPQVKIKKQNPIKKNQTGKNLFHLSKTIVKTVNIKYVREKPKSERNIKKYFDYN